MTRFIGIDPGPTPGFVALEVVDNQILRTDVVQCSSDIAGEVLQVLLGSGPAICQIEKFVVGNRSARSSSARAGRTTRDMIGQLREVFDRSPDPQHWFERSASEVKPWATDARLAEAGLLDAARGMTHARDAARHVLFCAVKGGHLPDPLSKRSK